MNPIVDPSSESARNRFSSVRLDRLSERRDDERLDRRRAGIGPGSDCPPLAQPQPRAAQ